MMRPRESFDQRLISAQLDIVPEPSELRWLHDVFGNSVAIALFDKRAKALRVASEVQLDHAPLDHAEIDVEDYARLFPFTYSSEDMPDLLRSIERQHLDVARVVDNWARAFVRNDGATETVAMLTDMATTIKRDFTYVPRHEKGTQTPIETLAKRRGTCRDFAVLMIRQSGPWASLRGSSRDMSTTRRAPKVASVAAIPMPGCASFCRGRAGSNSIRPTASLAIAASFALRCRGTLIKPCRFRERGAGFPPVMSAWMSRSTSASPSKTTRKHFV